jgi:hypothetical protein
MSSSDPFRTAKRLARTLALLVGIAAASNAGAQQAQGFAVERFYPSAAGGGWFVMDDLDLHGGFGGAIELTGGYARNPLDLTSPDGTEHLAPVSNEAFADFSVAATYARFRLYLNFSTPITVNGHSGILEGYEFTAPSVTVGNNPDTISDARIGFDARLFGEPGSPFRIGVGAQLLVPSGNRGDYVTDGTYRAMFRILAAGDVGSRFTYAAQVGFHLRPLDDSPALGSPQGSELLFGVAAGAKLFVTDDWLAIIGPEVFGETALRSFFGGPTTGVEGLLTGRFESTGIGRQIRFKLGIGAGIDPQFGVPQWRIVGAVEMFGRQAPTP